MTAPARNASSPLITTSDPSIRPPRITGPLRTATFPCQTVPAGISVRPTSRLVVAAL